MMEKTHAKIYISCFVNKKNGGSNDGHPHGGGPQIEFETSKDTNSSCSYLSPLERGQKNICEKTKFV